METLLHSGRGYASSVTARDLGRVLGQEREENEDWLSSGQERVACKEAAAPEWDVRDVKKASQGK